MVITKQEEDFEEKNKKIERAKKKNQPVPNRMDGRGTE